jgi:hypothetical protein
VVLVRVGEDDDIDPAVPRRQALVERDQQPPWIGPTVDQQAPAPPALDEDRVTLSDVEQDDVGHAARPVGDGQREPEDRTGQGDRCDPRAPAGPPRGTPYPLSRTGQHTSPWSTGARRQERSGPARDGEDHHERGSRADHVPGRAELHARHRQPRPDADDDHHRPIERPRRQPDEDGEHGREADSREDADDERERTRRHGRRNERHDHEVHDRRDEREPPKLEEHDRRRGCLRRERHAQDLGEKAPDPAGGRSREALGQGRAPGDDPGGGEDGEAEAGVVDPGGVDEQQTRDRPAERRRSRPGPPELVREQRHARHHARPDHRR